jgi:short subunit dehydrogenase-like uncharacterized protein
MAGPTSDEREFDVVLWGATGFTGGLVAEHLYVRHGVGRDLRWALGGRDRAKLESVRAGLGSGAADLDLVVGDSLDAEDMAALAARTRVVCTTVGPYARLGSELVEACVAAGSDYCDLTGETHWMRSMIDRHGEAAAASGARIVHSCGFDCIPSDVGVWFLQQEMLQRHGVASPRVKLGVGAFRGGVSGGSTASMLAMMESARTDPSVLEVWSDPYGLNPPGERWGPDDGERLAPHPEPAFGQWAAPFVMGAVNTKVVRRTNALLGFAYGRDFRYEESMLTGAGPVGAVRAVALAGAFGGGMAAVQLPPLRRLIGELAPGPGQGPSPGQRERGFFELHLWGAVPGDDDTALRVTVRGDRDPGYGATSRMLGEAAVALAEDDLDAGGGFWTSASALGPSLAVRLPARAGVTLTVDD